MDSPITRLHRRFTAWKKAIGALFARLGRLFASWGQGLITLLAPLGRRAASWGKGLDAFLSRLGRLFVLRPLPLFAVAVSAAVLLALCLGGAVDSPPLTYFSYLYSSYALAAVCVALPGAVRRIQRAVAPSPEPPAGAGPAMKAAHRYLMDAEYRVRTLLYPSLGFNFFYAALKLAVGFHYHSEWMIGVGCYYMVLSGMRFTLLRRFLARRGQAEDAADGRLYRLTALGLLAMTLVMTGLVIQMVLLDRAYHYPGVLIYAFALYAFVKIGAAAPALLRARRGDSRVLEASRCLSFACALVSMLALQTALIDQFGGAGDFSRTANTLTGAAVCLLLLMLSAVMLRRSGLGSHPEEE